MVMKEARRARAHETGGDLGGGRLVDEGLELGDALPVAQVLEEGGRAVGRPDRPFQGAGVGHQRVDASAERFNPRVEDPAQHDGAVLAIASGRVVHFLRFLSGFHA
jgi:hypothetical protein